MRKKLSACILTFNCPEKLEKLLSSLDFVDEIVVVDSGSTDNTVEIAKKYGAKIFYKEFINSGEQRNYSTEKASNNWVLALDSDEFISPQLKEEILCALSSDEYDGYFLPRYTYFLGKPIKHSDWYPDYAVRLYDRQVMSFENSIVHEKVKPAGRVAYFKNPLHHFSYDSLVDYMAKFKKYTAMQTKRSNIPKNHKNLILMVLKPVYRFFKMYIPKKGFLDGWRGLLLASLSGFYDFKVHYLAEKTVLKGKSSSYVIGVVILLACLTQAFLIAKFSFLALAIPLFLIGFSLLFFNLQTALVILLLSTLFGQIARIYLPSGGGIIFSDLVAPGFLAGWFFYKLLKKPQFKRSPIDKTLFLLVAIFAITFIVAIPQYYSLQSAFYLIRLLTYFALFWPLYDLLQDPRRLEIAQKTISFLLYSLVFLGVLQLILFPYMIVLMPYGWDPHKNRLFSTFLDPNFLSAFFNIGFGFFLAQYYNSSKKGLIKILPLIILGLAIIFTFSRSGYLMLFTILLIFGLLRDRRILISSVVFLFLVNMLVPQFQERIIGGFKIDESAAMRFGSWQTGMELITRHPILGVGYNNLISAKQDAGLLEEKDVLAHGDAGIDSSLMVIWSTSGLVGIVIFLLLYAQMVYHGFRSFKQGKNQYARDLGLAVCAVLIGLFAHSFFVNSLLYPHILILLMTVLAIFYVYNGKNS